MTAGSQERRRRKNFLHQNKVEKFDSAIYNMSLKKMVIDTNMQEDGKAARKVVEHICSS